MALRPRQPTRKRTTVTVGSWPIGDGPGIQWPIWHFAVLGPECQVLIGNFKSPWRAEWASDILPGQTWHLWKEASGREQGRFARGCGTGNQRG